MAGAEAVGGIGGNLGKTAVERSPLPGSSICGIGSILAGRVFTGDVIAASAAGTAAGTAAGIAA